MRLRVMLVKMQRYLHERQSRLRDPDSLKLSSLLHDSAYVVTSLKEPFPKCGEIEDILEIETVAESMRFQGK